MTLDTPVEVKPAGLVSNGLGLAVLLEGLCPLVEALLLVDLLRGALLAGHEAQDQEAGHEEHGVHGEGHVTRGAQPLMASAARFRRFIQKCEGLQMCVKKPIHFQSDCTYISVFCWISSSVISFVSIKYYSGSGNL